MVSKLSGEEKAAILLRAIGEDAAAQGVEPFSLQKLTVAIKQEARQPNSLLAGELKLHARVLNPSLRVPWPDRPAARQPEPAGAARAGGLAGHRCAA